MVALVKLLLDHALAKRVLFVVDRRTLARQAINKGFKFLSPAYNCHWVTSGNWKSHKHPPFSPPPVRPLALSTAFTPKANS